MTKPVYGSSNPAPEGPDSDGITRYGSVIELLPEKEAYYRQLHAEAWPAVQSMIAKCDIKNYNIFVSELEGRKYLFSFFEYHGTDFAAVGKIMAADEETRRWWAETDPCQKRLPNTPQGANWFDMERVFFQK